MKAGPVSKRHSFSSKVARVIFPAIVCIASFLLFSSFPKARAGDSDSFSSVETEKKMVVLIVDHLRMEDISPSLTPFLWNLSKKHSVGLLSTRAAGGLGAEYLSLGSGARVRGVNGSDLCLNTQEVIPTFSTGMSAGQAYLEFTGREPPPNGVVCLKWEEVRQKNEELGLEENIGLLGQCLDEGGINVAVVGNSDLLEALSRNATLICANKGGSIPLGDVSDSNLEPFLEKATGSRVDLEKVTNTTRRFLGESSFVVVDSGDTARVEKEQKSMSLELFEERRNEAISQADHLAEELFGLLDMKTSAFVVISPRATEDELKQGNYLTPLVAAGEGFDSGPRILSSDSTRRMGIVDNSDFLPTVLNFFGIPIPGVVSGSGMKSSSCSESLEYLGKLDRQVPITRNARWMTIVPYCVLNLILFALIIVRFFPRRFRLEAGEGSQGLRRVLAPLCIVFLAGPLAFITISAFFYENYAFPVLYCIVFMLIVGLGVWWLQKEKKLDSAVSLCLLTAGVLILDALFGGRLLMFPLLGGGALEGMRFFGFSNVIAGILISSSIWGAAGIISRDEPQSGTRRLLVLVGLVFMSFVLGFGMFGANFGGFVTAIFTVLIFFFVLSPEFLSWKKFVLAAIITLVSGALMLTIDALLVRSHAGRGVSLGMERLIPIIQNKISIHLQEITKFLIPAVIFILAIIAFLFWIRRPGSFWMREWEQNKPRMAALYSTLLGSLLGFAINDSGITLMASMALISFLCASYYALRGEGLDIPGVSPGVRPRALFP
ncbi:MAG: hypothetical protein PHO53_00940 [Actinomycetota bacterium]|nr:hypothetical protein [Actinomycetota bacterium]